MKLLRKADVEHLKTNEMSTHKTHDQIQAKKVRSSHRGKAWQNNLLACVFFIVLVLLAAL